jgi:hypothetical protein
MALLNINMFLMVLPTVIMLSAITAEKQEFMKPLRIMAFVLDQSK